jgi:hypothetical protein
MRQGPPAIDLIVNRRPHEWSASVDGALFVLGQAQPPAGASNCMSMRSSEKDLHD